MLTSEIRKIVKAIEKYRLKNVKFTVISNDCWGDDIYSAINRPYNTPFVALLIKPQAYLKLLKNLDHYLASELIFKENQDGVYPVGQLDNEIDIHFIHYETEQEAKEKWERRLLRFRNCINKGATTIVKYASQSDCSIEFLDEFHSLDYPRLLTIDTKSHSCFSNHISYSGLSVKESLDGLQLYKRRYKYFDFVHWIKKNEVKQTLVSKLISLFILRV